MLLIFFATFILVTVVLSLYTKSNPVSLRNKLRVQFSIGGLLVFLGSGRKASNPRPIGKKTSLLLALSVFIGMSLFYAFFIPKALEFVPRFIGYVTGRIATAPEPIAVPVPLLFSLTDLVPYLLISIAIAVSIHEIMHAVVALREGVSIKSWGIGMFFLIPLAFVELDEKEFNSSPPKTRINIVSAGVLGNAMLTALAVIAIIAINLLAPIFMGTPTQAVIVYSVDCSICDIPSCPAAIAGIGEGDVIISINSSKIYSQSQVVEILSRASIGDNLTVEVCSSNGTCRNITLALIAQKSDSPGRPCLGIKFGDTLVFIRDSRVRRIPWLESFITLLYFVYIFNFSLFMLNAVPLFITDGALFLRNLPIRKTLIAKLISSKALDIVNTVVIAVVVTLSTYLMIIG